jgi:hypothetical protein
MLSFQIALAGVGLDEIGSNATGCYPLENELCAFIDHA